MNQCRKFVDTVRITFLVLAVKIGALPFFFFLDHLCLFILKINLKTSLFKFSLKKKLDTKINHKNY